MSDEAFEKTIQLVQGAQAGDRGALEELFARYLPRVRQIVALRLGYRLRDLTAHEDIVQETLLSTFRNLDQFEERSEGSFRHWLARCVVNAANDHFRRSTAEKRGGGKVRAFSSYESEDMTGIVFEGDSPTPSVILGKKELSDLIEEKLLDMKPHHREAITLRLFCEMSYEEMGVALGIAEEATVRKLFSRALSELRKRCDEQ